MGKRKKEDNTFLRKKTEDRKQKKNTQSFLVSFKGKECDYCTLCSFIICPEKGSTYFARPIVVYCRKDGENL